MTFANIQQLKNSAKIANLLAKRDELYQMMKKTGNESYIVKAQALTLQINNLQNDNDSLGKM